MASTDDVRDIDQRLTELEFRMRLFDRATLPKDEGAGNATAAPNNSERARTARELPESTGGSGGDTGRSRPLETTPK